MASGFIYFQLFKYHRLPQRCYEKRRFENDTYFKRLGLPIYHFVLTHSFLRYFNPRVYLKGRKRDYIKIYYEETKQSETSHWMTIAITGIIQLGFLYEGDILLFVSLTLFSISFNVYPILLQRKNRFALESRFKSLIDL